MLFSNSLNQSPLLFFRNLIFKLFYPTSKLMIIHVRSEFQVLHANLKLIFSLFYFFSSAYNLLIILLVFQHDFYLFFSFFKIHLLVFVPIVLFEFLSILFYSLLKKLSFVTPVFLELVILFLRTTIQYPALLTQGLSFICLTNLLLH